MRHGASRSGLALLGALVSLSTACPDEPPCDDLNPICEWEVCAAHPDCAGAEICDNELDDDGDALVDADDPDCVESFSPVTDVDCVGQETETAAGGDTDTIVDFEDCEDPAASDAGDGDTAQVLIAESDQGAVEVAIDIVNGDPGDPAPTATSTITIRFGYEPGGDRVIVSAFGASPNGDTVTDASCDSLGYQIDIDGRGFVPTDPDGGEFFCTVRLSQDAAGSYRVLIGALLAIDDEGDGTSNRNDLCRNAVGTLANKGCPVSGIYIPGVHFYCANPSQCFSSFPAPLVCGDCGVETDGLSVDGFGTGQVRVHADGQILCEGCKLVREEMDSELACADGAECFQEPTGAIGADQLGGDYTLEIQGSEPFVLSGDDGAFDQLLVVPEALDGPDPLLVTLEVETTDPGDDLLAEFELESGGQTYVREIETQEGAGIGRIQFVADFVAALRWNATPGWKLESAECDGGADPAEIVIPTRCLFLLQRQALNSLVELTQTGLENLNFAALDFGLVDINLARLAAAPAGERFSVAGSNGVGVYEADDFSLVPSLSTIGGFQIQNVLGSLFLDAPQSPNDAHWYYTIPSGTGATQWFPEIPGFGATQISFTAVRDATYVDGDPNVGRAVFTTAGSVNRLFFEDLGFGWPFLNSGSLFLAPAGYSVNSAFQTSASDHVLFTARNNTAGANGGLYRGLSGASPTLVGELGVDPRLLRCASAQPGTWICVATNFGSASANVAVWDGAATAALAGTIATGTNPLVPAVAAAGGEVLVGIPNFADDTVTLARLDGSTGAALGTITVPVPAGCTEPSSALLVQGATRLVVACHGSDALGLIDPIVP